MENKEQCQQGVSIDVRANGQVLMMRQSMSSNGLLGGHGNYIKLHINDDDEVLGGAIRVCLNDKRPGFYMPHMHKEKEAHQTMMRDYLEDRGTASDKVFYKGTRSFSVQEYVNHIECRAGDNSVSGHHPWVKGGPHVVVPHNASDTELAQAMRRTLELCLA